MNPWARSREQTDALILSARQQRACAASCYARLRLVTPGRCVQANAETRCLRRVRFRDQRAALEKKPGRVDRLLVFWSCWGTRDLANTGDPDCGPSGPVSSLKPGANHLPSLERPCAGAGSHSRASGPPIQLTTPTAPPGYGHTRQP